MEPLARAGYVMIAGMLVLATTVGAVGGAFAWAVRGRPVRRSLPWVGLLAVIFFLTESYFLEHIRVIATAALGLPALILALLGSWLVAGFLETRGRWHRIGSALVGFACGVVLGFACMMTARFAFWTPIPVAITADVILLAVVWRIWKRFV